MKNQQVFGPVGNWRRPSSDKVFDPISSKDLIDDFEEKIEKRRSGELNPDYEVSPNGHTRGPWYWEKQTDDPFTRIGEDIADIGGEDRGERDQYCVGVCYDCGPHGDETTFANAKLIAAAPALELAWRMVPEEVKQQVFEMLDKNPAGDELGWVKLHLDSIKEAS